MKTLKKITLGLGMLIGLFLLIALLLPATYHVERSIIIEKPAQEVYPHVANLHNWTAWNPWTASDPTVKYTISGSGHEPGSVWAWNGEAVGIGTLTIQELHPEEKIVSRLAFKEPQMFESDDIWNFEETAEGTRVTWINEGKLDYPIDRVFGLFLDSTLGPDFEKGLAKLKEVAENS